LFWKIYKSCPGKHLQVPHPACTPTPYNQPVGKMVQFVDFIEDS